MTTGYSLIISVIYVLQEESFSTTPTFTILNDDPPDPIEVDMGAFGLGTISGETWEDLDGNGTQDGGDAAVDVGDICLWLIDPVSGDAVDVLDVMGNSLGAPYCVPGGGTYTFTDLPPGQYKVEFPDAPSVGGNDYFLTDWAGTGSDPLASGTDSDACPANCTGFGLPDANGCTNGFFIESCNELEDVEAGYYQALNISGKVFKDADADNCFGGIDLTWDAVPFAVPAINVSITSGGNPVNDVFGNPVAAISVDGNTAGGEYCFMDLPPGDYVVNFSDPGDPWRFSELTTNVDPSTTTGCSDVDPATGDTVPIEAESGDLTNACGDVSVEVSAGLYKLLSIGGVVFDDEDEDCVMGANETGFADIEVTVEANCSNGLTFGPQTVITDPVTGMWSIDELIPPCDCVIVTIDESMFNVSNGPLGNHVTCGTAADPQGDEAGTNNGSDPGPDSETACVEMFCDGTLPDMNGMAQLTIDFGFFFECSNATTPIYPTCEISGEENDCLSGDFNYICDVDLLDNYCGTMPPPPNATGPSPLCSNGGGPHNTSWVSFIAGDDSADFLLEIFVTGCTGATGAEGLQWGIVETCEFEEVICDGNCVAAGTIVIDINNPPAGSGELIPGEQYYFWLDGCNGSVCDFEMNLISGGGTFDFPFVEVSECSDCLDTSEPAIHEYDLCTGAVGQVFCIDSADDDYDDLNIEYFWNLDDTADDIPSNTGMDGNLGFTEENCISLDFDEATYPPGEYELCMTFLGSCCDSEGPFCMTITIADPVPNDYAPISVCLNDFVDADYMIPAEDVNGNMLDPWFGALPINPEMINEEDDYGGVIPNFPLAGCETAQSVDITDLPVPAAIWQDVVCSTDLEPGGMFENGLYTVGTETPPNDPQDVPIPTMLTNVTFENGTNTPLDYQDMGCDSVVSVIIDLLEVEGSLSQEPCDQNFGVQLIWENEGPDLSNYFNVEYHWYLDSVDPANEEMDADGIENDHFVFASGTYILEVCADLPYLNPNDHGGEDFKTCCFPFEIEVMLDNPPPPVIEGATSLCVPDTIQTYTIDPDFETGGIINWTVAGGVIMSGVGTSEIEVNWGNSNSGVIVVIVGGLCGASEDEFEVEIFEQPVASIADAGPICINQPLDILFNGAMSPTLDYTWDFGVGVEQSGTGSIGPGPHSVQWATPGMQTITLITEEGGCPSEQVEIQVEVLEPLPAPQVTCNGGTTNELTFCWNDVGADDYIPTIITQTGSGTINYTTGELCLTVTGLNILEEVTVQVEAVDNGVCDNVLSNQQLCEVQNCTIPILTVECTIPDICLDAGVGMVDLSACVSADLPGAGVYSGPGVTGTNFDPSDAAVLAGANTIMYNYETDDMCTNSISFDIVVNPLPVAEFTVTSPICESDVAQIEFSGATLPDGGFVWDTGGANETSVNGAGPIDLSFPGPGTYTISLITTDSGCESVAATMDIVVEEQVATPEVSCVNQTTSSVEFGWTVEPGVTYDVDDSAVPANGTINSSAGSFIVTDLDENQVVNITVIAISDNSCPNAEMPFQCEAIACPGATLGLGPDQLVCFEDPSFQLEVESNNPQVDPAVGDITWGVDTPSGDGVDQNGNVDPTILGEGVWNVSYNVINGDCEYDGTVEVEVLGPGNVILTPDFAVCETGGTVQLDGEVTDVDLDNPVATWNGPGVDTDGLFDPSAAALGVNTLTYFVIDDNGCEYSGEMDVTVEEEISITTNCIEAIDNIVFTWDDDPCAADWIVTAVSNGQTIVGTQVGTSYLVDGLSDGQMVEFTLEMVSTTCQCPFSVVVECVATDCPPIVLDLEDHLQEMCVGDNVVSYQIGVIIEGSQGPGSGEWTGVGVTPDGMFDPSIGPGTYELDYLYTESGCDFPISTTINIFEDPSAIVDVEDAPCFENNLGSIFIETIGGSEPLTITINGENVVTDEFIEYAPGTYEIFISDANNCSYSETVTVEAALEQSVEIVGELNAVSPNPLDFTFDTSVPLDNIVSTEWTLDGTVICDNCDMVTIDTLVRNAEVCLTIVYNDGCVINTCETISIIELTQIYYPNIISPNDDGNNDWWTIGSNAIESIQYVSIYDRWGERIFTVEEGDPILEFVDNEVRIWDGRFKERAVVPGVYVFVIEYTSSEGRSGIVDSGDITVIE